MLNWNRILAGSAFLLLPIAMFGQLDLGDRITSAQIPKHGTVECAATPSQGYPCVLDLEVGGVKFNKVGYDSKTKRVKYLITSDAHFKTKEGLRVGDWIDVSEDQVFSVYGWNIYGPTTKDGWHIVLGIVLPVDGVDEKVHFRDGAVVLPSASRTGPPRTGKVQIREFEKGGL
jgi:hypothetical protein